MINLKLISMKIIVYSSITLVTIVTLGILLSFKSPSPAPIQKWYQVTVIESVVPGGVGRSRMISQDENGKMEEIKLNNFFSLAGINFENIKDNDVKITQKITDLTSDDWELYDITSGVYSGGGKSSGNGIFITRYLYNKAE